MFKWSNTGTCSQESRKIPEIGSDEWKNESMFDENKSQLDQSIQTPQFSINLVNWYIASYAWLRIALLWIRRNLMSANNPHIVSCVLHLRAIRTTFLCYYGHLKGGPLYWHESTFIPPWRSNYAHYKRYDSITYPFTNSIELKKVTW